MFHDSLPFRMAIFVCTNPVWSLGPNPTGPRQRMHQAISPSTIPY
jgi:hypothetical protein